MKGHILGEILENKGLPNFCLFASGSGSNAYELALFSQENNLPLKLCLTDNPDAGVIDKMKELGIQTFVVSKGQGMSKTEHESQIEDILKENNIEWLFLAGYMRILSNDFVKNYYDNQLKVSKIVNIHPSLLPAFPGAYGYQDAFNYGVKESGITIHFVDEGVDTGPIIFQKSFERQDGDCLEDFSKRGLALEHKFYPYILNKIIHGEFSITKNNERLFVQIK